MVTDGWWRPELRRRQAEAAAASPTLLLPCSAAFPGLPPPLPPVVEHRQDADLRQRGEPEEVGLAGARLHPPCLVLLRRLPGSLNPVSHPSIHSSPTRIFFTQQQAAKPFSAPGSHLRARAWEQQRLQRRVLVRDHQPAGRPSSKSTNTADDQPGNRH